MKQPPTYTLCRDLSHSWGAYTAIKIGRRFERALMCDRCDTIKIQVLDNRGRILSTKYRYPQDYLRKGHGRLNAEMRAAIRLLTIQQNLNSGTNRN